MRIKKTSGPKYDLCTDTVTVYRLEGDRVTRNVIENTFFDSEKVQNVNKTGSAEANGSLIVIPAASAPQGQPVYVGDKVIFGKGPYIRTKDEWKAFIPVKVEDLVIVKYVDPKRVRGEIVHWEAGG